jgi:Lon protease-like protein
MQRKLAIFPLKLVLFPSSKYILHIFEKRYITMINRVIANEEGFGIVTRNDNDLSKIGTYVQITQIMKEENAKDFDIVIRGIERFRLLDHWFHEDGYMQALVEPYDDVSSDAEMNLIEELKIKFVELISEIDFKLNERFWAGFDSAEMKSYKIAEKSGLNLDQQQVILAIQHEEERIHYLLDHFDKIKSYIGDKALIRRLVLNDGYLET